jgi:hypothetical protein
MLERSVERSVEGDDAAPMPVPIETVERIIRACSNPGDAVLDL